MNHREFRALFPHFMAPSWDGWFSVIDLIFGVPPADAELMRKITGRSSFPTAPVSEAWIVKGRGSGGSHGGAFVVAYIATTRRYPRVPGERIYIGVFAPSQKQASITHGYIRGLLRSVPSLSSMIAGETRDSIELVNGLVIEVMAASSATLRGRAYAAVVVEEAAFLPSDDAADPDRELLRAVRPALARVHGSLLVVLSSPHRRDGELYRTWAERFGKDDPDVLVVHADTQTLNPTFSTREIERAYREDAVSARSEYGALFRDDVSGFVSATAIAAVVRAGVTALPADGRRAVAHLDFATGTAGDNADAAALAVAVAGLTPELALVQRWEPPFDPAVVAAEVAGLLRRYGLRRVGIDRFAPGLVGALLRQHGIEAEPAPRTTSEAFINLLTLINAGQVRLLDDPVLRRELSRLERRPGAAGREIVEHPRNGHDDVAAASAFALVAAYETHAVGGWAWGETRSGRDYVVDLERRVRDLARSIGVRAFTAAASVRQRFRRTPEDVAARARRAAELRLARQAAREQRAQARQREWLALAQRAAEVAEDERQRLAALSGQAEILEAIRRQGYWWPGESGGLQQPRIKFPPRR